MLPIPMAGDRMLAVQARRLNSYSVFRQFNCLPAQYADDIPRYALDVANSAITSRLQGTTDLPDGLSGHLPVQPLSQKYSCFLLTQITSISIAVSSYRGAARDRHGRGAGCGGRSSVRRAGQTARGRMALNAYGEVVWS